MTIFHQQGQHVQNQYNAGGDIHIGVIQDQKDLKKHLELLNSMVEKAISEGAIDQPTGEAVNRELQHAASGEKKSITAHLSKAGEILKGISAAEGLVSTIKTLIVAVSNWFI
jgi:uncharacterized protein (UPF0332 family)